jgi:hypothetical protein
MVLLHEHSKLLVDTPLMHVLIYSCFTSTVRDDLAETKSCEFFTIQQTYNYFEVTNYSSTYDKNLLPQSHLREWLYVVVENSKYSLYYILENPSVLLQISIPRNR